MRRARRYASTTRKSDWIAFMGHYCGINPILSTGLFPLSSGKLVGYIPRMETNAVLDRIRQRLRATGKSARRASLDSGMGSDLIRDLERDASKSLSLRAIRGLAMSLGVTPQWLAFGVDGDSADQQPDDQQLPLAGDVAAGVWMEIDPIEQVAGTQTVPFSASPIYPRSAQYALRVRGTSINKFADDGDFLRCIDVGISGVEPASGDLVIVQRERDQGSLREVTAKVIRRSKDVIRLEPASTDTTHKPILVPVDQSDEATNVRVVAIVDAVLRVVRTGA